MAVKKELKGVSKRNIKYMVCFARGYGDPAILQQAVAKLPADDCLSFRKQPVSQLKDKIMAEYALRDVKKPIGVSECELTRALPENLKSSLPTIEEIEAELSGGSNE